jgi:hypothetical protein
MRFDYFHNRQGVAIVTAAATASFLALLALGGVGDAVLTGPPSHELGVPPPEARTAVVQSRVPRGSPAAALTVGRVKALIVQAAGFPNRDCEPLLRGEGQPGELASKPLPYLAARRSRAWSTRMLRIALAAKPKNSLREAAAASALAAPRR